MVWPKLLIYFISAVLGVVVLYFIIKYAVKSAIIETMAKKNESKKTSIPEPKWNQKQLDLKEKYDRGEITFEQYQKEWGQL